MARHDAELRERPDRVVEDSTIDLGERELCSLLPGYGVAPDQLPRHHLKALRLEGLLQTLLEGQVLLDLGLVRVLATVAEGQHADPRLA